MSAPGNGYDDSDCDPCRFAVAELGHKVDGVLNALLTMCKSVDQNTRVQNELMRELIQANTQPQRNSSRLNTALIVVLLALTAMMFAREHGAIALNDTIDHIRGAGPQINPR